MISRQRSKKAVCDKVQTIDQRAELKIGFITLSFFYLWTRQELKTLYCTVQAALTRRLLEEQKNTLIN